MLSLGARLLDAETDGAPTSQRVVSEMRQLDVGGEDEKIDSIEEDNRDEESGCLAWGDERAADGLVMRLFARSMFLLELNPSYLFRIEETFLPWLNRTVDTILPLLTPQATPFEPYSRTDLPPPLYQLKFLEDAPQGSTSASQINDESDALEPGWKWAKLRRNTRVTDGDWWQDVREIDLDLEDSDQ